MQTDLLLVPFGATYAGMRAAAIAAEEAGFDGIWTWDHLRDAEARGGRVPEAMTALAGLAEATSRVMLGTLVLNVANHHPGVLANMAATLQEVSGNRFLLGIGAGGNRRTPYAAEQTMLGRPVPGDRARAEQVAEAVGVMKRLWAGEAGDFEGRHYQLRRPSGYPRPDVPPPIIVGGFGPRMAAIAGRYADGFNTQAWSAALPRLAETAREEHRAAGRDPDAFLLTAFAGLSEGCLRASGSGRRELEALGTARVILLVEPPFDVEAIRAAGAMLRE